MVRRVYPRFFMVVLGCGLLGACTTPQQANSADPAEQALQGDTPDNLNATFGPPLLRRTDGPAQVWLYQTINCNLDVFLYRDHAGVFRVRAVLPDNGMPLHACLPWLAQPTTAATLERGAAS